MKRILIVSLTLILSISLLTGCNKKNETNMENDNVTENNLNESDNNTSNEESNKQPGEQDVLFTQVVGTLKFDVISLEYKDNKTKIKYAIINNGTEDIILNKYTIKIVDKNGNGKIITIKSNNTFIPNKKRNIIFYVDGDLTKDTSITFELVEE